MMDRMHRLCHRLLPDHSVRKSEMHSTWTDYWGEAGRKVSFFICTCGAVWPR
ncbi:hypothetical protein SEA_EASYJONES_42 [Mycobacterium phage EasyJones]|uniref:Uncharacterized protein n=6 Tax=Bixzunavirus TaxID=680114 RepID=A0A8F2E7U0_9CAUD|nr:hypothetical protein OLP41_gp045 [Mycobacterium phage I3]QWT30519.1 hypothetical protein PBI_I3_45 [Mycobacterium phage I3]QZM07348.1 hypothetical protein SEA_EASYJONES_42 [Mycobacterium phage EasyJones]UVF61873.1 hypothetical protein SEA_JEDEDIAH_43 [Mycobacterium phage Jedediah]